MGESIKVRSLLFTVLGVIRLIRADPDPLQDFCVADLSSGQSFINGFPCKDPLTVTADDFSFLGIAEAANLTGNPLGATATFGFVRDWPALNNLGLSIARLDLLPGGVIMPHTHNLATEILFVIEGEVYTGFVTNSNNPKLQNKLYSKIVKKGEAFIFPRGLLHFQINKGTVPAATVNMLNSQNPGIQLMSIALFGTGIDPEVLIKSTFMQPEDVANVSAILGKFTKIFD